MNRNELHHSLAQEYTTARGFGVAKVKRPEFENVWFVIPPPPPTDKPKQLPLKSLARAHNTLNQLKRLDDANPLDKALSFLLLNREAVSSSRMEGTWSTIDHVLSRGDELLDDESRQNTESVRAYARSLDRHYKTFQKSGLKGFTLKSLAALHKEIMRPIDPTEVIAGKFRKPGQKGSVVQIGGIGRVENSIYNPAPPEHVKPCLDLLINWFQNEELVELGDAGMGLSLPMRMALGHSYFEAVHPFRDGNGRIGRMLWPLQMICGGHLPLYLSGYVEAEKREYGKALQNAQKKLNYSAIIEFVCEAMVSSHEENRISLKYLASLPEKWNLRSKSRSGSAAKKTLSKILSEPVFTIASLSKTIGVSFEAASNATTQLVRDKIVRERTGFGRNRIFAAEEVVHILSREFGQSTELAESKAHRLLKI